MKRAIKRHWMRATAAALSALMVITCEEFYGYAFMAMAKEEAAVSVPPLSTAPGELLERTREVVVLLGSVQEKLGVGDPVDAEITELEGKKAALDALKPQLDADLAAAEQRIIQQNLGSEALSIHAGLVGDFNTRFDTLRGHLDAVTAGATTENVSAALDYAAPLVPSESSTLNATQLPHRATAKAYRPESMPKGLLGFWRAQVGTLREIGGTPATGDPLPPDLAETPETVITPEIQALAAELEGNPVRIFEYVRNNFRYEPYYGSVKGAAQTLREGAGNDADLASLAIALLRASGIPARWVYGTIEVSMDDLKAWLGVDHPSRTLDVLSKNDIPFEPIVGGGTYQAVRMDHVWVRVYVDNDPYRGAVAYPGDGFIDIDPSFKRLARGEYVDVASEVGFDATALLDEIRTRPGTLVGADSVEGVDDDFIFSKLQAVGAEVDNLIAASGVTAQEAFRTAEIETETLGVLPASRPYRVDVEGAAYSELPDAFRLRMKVEVLHPDATVDVSLDRPSVELAGKRLTLSYRGATPADESAIEANLGEEDFPAYLVSLKPVLSLEGEAPLEGTAIGMGFTQSIRTILTSPLGRRVSETPSSVTTGTYTALVVDLSKVSAAQVEERRQRLAAALADPSNLDSVEGELLHAIGVNFFFQADRLNDITSNALEVVVQRDPSLALVTHRISVQNLFDLPFTAKADSVAIDVARDVLFPVASGASIAPEKQFLLTSGFTSSSLEQTSLTSFFVSDAISTVRGIVKANALGQQIYTIDENNLAVADTLNQPQEVIDEVKNLAQAGLVITIPQNTVPLGARDVSVFIALDPLLASSAFIIKASPYAAGGLVLTEQIKAGEILALGPPTSYQQVLETGEAWFKSVASATDEAGLEYIPAIAAINRWFAENTALDRLTTVASAIAVSTPLNFVASLPGIFNVSALPEVISPIASPGVQDGLTISATITRGAEWTVKVFSITDPANPVATFTGTEPALEVYFTGDYPEGDYTYRIEAQETPPEGPEATPRGGVFKIDNTPPEALIAELTEDPQYQGDGLLSGLVGVRGTANDPNFRAYKVEVFPVAEPVNVTQLTEKTTPKVSSILAPWNTSSIETGDYTVRLTVEDMAGNVSTAEQSASLSNAPQDTQIPSIAITSPASGSTVTGTITVTATANDNPPGAVADVYLFSDGELVGHDAVAPYEFLLNTNTLSTGSHVLVARAEDTSGFLADSTPVVIDTAGNVVHSFHATPNPFSPRSTLGVQDVTSIFATIPESQPFTLELLTIDGGIAMIDGGTVTLVDLPQGTLLRTFTGVGPYVEIPWDGTNEAGYKILEANELPELAGTYEARLTSGTQTASIVIGASGANPAPIVEIISPEKNSDVNGKISVIGTVKDLGDDLESYTATLIRHGESTGPVIGQGTTPVERSEIATLDPTLLENDFYEIRLSAVDSLGQTSTYVQPITIVGEQKIGIFTLTFQDMVVPVHGIPITVQRTYDTRLTSGRDFGIGWRLDLVAGSLKIRDNNDVMITLPDNRRARFSFNPSGGTDDLNAFTQTHFPGVVPEVFSPFRVAKYEPERTVPQWDLRPVGETDIIAVPTQVVTVEGGGYGPVPQVVDVDYYYYDFTPYNPTAYIVSDQQGMEYEYAVSNGGRLIQVTEPNGATLTITDDGVTHSSGRAIVIERDASDRVVKIFDPDNDPQDPEAKFVEYRYEAPTGQLSASLDRELNKTDYLYIGTRLEKILDPRGIQAVKNEYDGDGRLLAHTDADGNRIVFDHNIDGRQEVVTDRRSNITVYVYNDDGNVLAQTNALGHTKRYEYDAAGNETAVIDELGRATRSTYDGYGNLLSRTDALGNTTSFKYNDKGLVTRTEDPLGRVNLNEYDADGNLLRTVNALGHANRNEHDGLGRLIATVDTLGTRTEFDYFDQPSQGRFGSEVIEQRVISSEQVLLRKTTFTHDGLGRQLTQTIWKPDTPGGAFLPYATTTTVYNANGQVGETQDTLGHSTFTTYNAIGQQYQVTDKRGNVTTFLYSDRGHLTVTEYPEVDFRGTPVTPTEVVDYDEEGNRIYHEDRNGNVTETRYDKLNRPWKVIHSDGSFRITTYGPAGQVIAETDERGFTTVFGYDLAGRRETVTDPLGKVTTFKYNDAGQQKAVVDALERRTEFEFDALGRQVRTIFADGTSRSVEFDSLGRRVAEVDEMGIRTEFGYAVTGELLEVRQPDPDDASLLTTVTRFNYDELGRKTKQIDALGRETLFDYGVRGELASRSRPLGETEYMTYDPQGNLETRTDFNGVTTTFQYNNLNQLAAKLFPDGSSHAFAYYPGGQRESATITPVVGAPRITAFLLDGRNRLVQQTNPDATTLQWAYDASGNRTRVATPALDVTYTYTPRNELFQVIKDGVEWARYTYNDVGSRKSVAYINGTKQVLDYNLKNQLLTIQNIRVATGSSNTNYLLDPALLSAWRLNESSAPFADATLENPLDEQGAGATAEVPGIEGSGVNFGVSGDSYLATTTPSVHDEHVFPKLEGSLAFHYRPDTSGITQHSVFLGVRMPGPYVRGLDSFARLSSEELFFGGRSGAIYSGVLDWDPAQTYAISYTWGPGGSRIYRDGVEVSSTPGLIAMDDSFNRLVVGNRGTAPEGGAADGAQGTMDEVALFNRALSGEEVADIAARGLTPQVDTVFSSYTYTVDPRGLRTRVIEHDGRQVDYSYDFLRRLVQEKITENVDITTIDYVLDDVGNRLEKWVTNPDSAVDSTVYGYNANDELLTESGPDGLITYTYNDNGETTSKAIAGGGATTYEWDHDGRLVGAVTPADNLVFTYDVDGIRDSKTVNGNITRFVVDKNRDYAQVLEERDGIGALTRAYIHGDDLISQHFPDGDMSFYHHDGQLSVRQLTDKVSQKTNDYSYDASGVLLASNGSTPNSYLYAGEQHDYATRLCYIRARYLDCRLGRFRSVDAFNGVSSDPASLHKYIHTHADPVNNSDPSGYAIGFFLASFVALLITAVIVAYARGLEVTYVAAAYVTAAIAIAALLITLAWRYLGFSRAVAGAYMEAGSRVLRNQGEDASLYKKVEDASVFLEKTDGGADMAFAVRYGLEAGDFRVGPQPSTFFFGGLWVGATVAGVPVISEDIVKSKPVEEVAVVIMGEYEHVTHGLSESAAGDAFNAWLKLNNKDPLKLYDKYGDEYQH